VSPGRPAEARAARHAALGDPVRLAIVDELATSDRSPRELGQLTGTESNLLAHHLDVLERVGLVSRKRSSGDGRRRYVQLGREALAELLPGSRAERRPALFVCTQNSARSQLAAALWIALADQPAESAGTHPAERVHPGAVRAGHRVGLDLSGATPRSLDVATLTGRLVITVCDRAHEELEPASSWLHWSIADPVTSSSRTAFDRTVAELHERIAALVDAA
jgi:ArsR family transcriptional regulator, arsenate/arsenite/antimonite-responsive transcriptional repressor / arsenate reductase (thioredoxin)